MESVDSSPNCMRARRRFDAKKENSPGGSECDEIMSVSSSTSGSAVNGPYARKLSNNGIKNRTSNKKTPKNFGSIRSFRRRAKPRVIQSPVPMSDDEEESLVDSSVASPHYLKATTSSECKKSRSQASPQHSQSTFHGSGRNISHSSQSNLALSTTSSLRNVRIFIKRASFKPKRSLLRHSKVSDDVGADRATYSSTIKDSKFPVPVEELHSGGQESEKSSVMKVCRYHHCSLHGHCQGSDDPAPPLKRFLYKRRQSLKKQKSMRPKVVSDRKKKQNKSQIVPEVESSNQERFRESIAVSDVESKNGLDSHEESYPQVFGDGYEDVQHSYLVELAFGETSFPERSYRDNLNILSKYSAEEQDFGGTSLRRKGYCLGCSCHNGEEVTTTPKRGEADLSLCEITSSSLDGNNNEIPQNVSNVVLGTSSPASFKKPKEPVDTCNNEGVGKDGSDFPVVFDETTAKGSAFSSSASCNSQTSTDSNSEEDAESTTESSTAGDSKVNEAARIEDSATDSPTHIGGRIQFSKPMHMSMWLLIHQHMSSNLSVESTNKPLQGADGESPVDGVDSELTKDSTTLSRESSDTSVGTETNESEIQENELRKLFAVKLVREAIEKILLPEVQDQASDDQSITSESTPRSELMENNQSKAFTLDNDAESDAGRVKGDLSSNPKEETVVAGNASGGEIKEPEKQAVRKSEKKAPKHWSNLKKWILLQRFIKELEKVRKFNPRKPRHLPLNPDPEAEKVKLRPQTVDGRKNAEEWMLDHALRQAVSQLAPTQKKKVALLVKAFETVVPPQEDSPVQFRAPRFRNNSLVASGNLGIASDDRGPIFDSVNQEMSIKMDKETEKAREVNDKCESSLNFQGSTDARNEELTSKEKKSVLSSTMPTSKNVLPASKEENTRETGAAYHLEGIHKDTNISLRSELSSGDLMCSNENTELEEPFSKNQGLNLEAMPTVQGLQDAVSDCTEGKTKDVGRQLLEGGEDDEAEDNMSPATSNGYRADHFSQSTDDLMEENHVSSNLRSGLTKSDALKLVKEAVDEILLPEIQDDSSDTQSVTSESVPDQDIPDLKAESLVSKKSKNWSKLKRLILLKRSIKALEKAREFKPQPHQVLPQTADPEAEKVELRRQMTDERKKAEQWMLDYAVQHIVTRLTPARKRRVSMLVEAFEAVVPFPEI
ncbi:calmodulin binding protein [Perilla frutescens var. frutescens]|nr:calmodulin binding protein [Perilla frutescens var. frutescens]